MNELLAQKGVGLVAVFCCFFHAVALQGKEGNKPFDQGKRSWHVCIRQARIVQSATYGDISCSVHRLSASDKRARFCESVHVQLYRVHQTMAPKKNRVPAAKNELLRLPEEAEPYVDMSRARRCLIRGFARDFLVACPCAGILGGFYALEALGISEQVRCVMDTWKALKKPLLDTVSASDKPHVQCGKDVGDVPNMKISDCCPSLSNMSTKSPRDQCMKFRADTVIFPTNSLG